MQCNVCNGGFLKQPPRRLPPGLEKSERRNFHLSEAAKSKKKQRAGDVEGGPPRDLEESVTPQCRHAAARHAHVGIASAPFIY